MWDRPVISLHGNGESVTLDNLSADWVLMQGAAGLGVSPVELSTAPLAGGGSVLQHRRFTEAEIVVPILLGRSRFMDRFEQRRTLERLCDGLVEIRIETAEGTRSRWGWYSDGLQGDYGEGEDSIDGQKLALTFLCLDQFWKGEEHSFVYKTNAPKKPFLSVATNGRENLWDGKQLTDYTQSVWDVVDDGLEKSGEDRLAGLDLDDWKVEATEGTPFTVDLSLKFLSGDGKGKARIVGVSYKDGVKLSETTLMETNRSGRFGGSFYPAPGADAVSVGLYVADSMGRDERFRVSNIVLWGPTEPPPPPEWVEVGRNLATDPGATNDLYVWSGWSGEGGNGDHDKVIVSADWSKSESAVRITRGTVVVDQGDVYMRLPEVGTIIAGATYTIAFSIRSLSDGQTFIAPTLVGKGYTLISKYPTENFTLNAGDIQRVRYSFVASADTAASRRYLSLSWRGAFAGAQVELSMGDIYEGEYDPDRPWFSGDHAPDGMRSEWLSEPNKSASVLYELQ